MSNDSSFKEESYNSNDSYSNERKDTTTSKEDERSKNIYQAKKTSPRVFLFGKDLLKSYAMTVKPSWKTMEEFLEAANKLFGSSSFKSVLYKQNGSEIRSLQDMRENDELQLSELEREEETPRSRSSNSTKIQTNQIITFKSEKSKPRKKRTTKKAEILKSLQVKDLVQTKLNHKNSPLKRRVSCSGIDFYLKELNWPLITMTLNLFTIIPTNFSNFVQPSSTLIANSNLVFQEKTQSKKFESNIKILHHVKSHVRHKSFDTTYNPIHKKRRDSTTLYTTLPVLIHEGSHSSLEQPPSEKLVFEPEYKLPKELCFDLQDSTTLSPVDPINASLTVIQQILSNQAVDSQNISIDPSNEQVSSGSLRALIRRLTLQLQNDDFVSTFLLTHDFFITSLDLLTILILLFRVPTEDNENKPIIPKIKRSKNSMNSMNVTKTSEKNTQGPVASPIFIPRLKSSSVTEMQKPNLKTTVSDPNLLKERMQLVIQFRIVNAIKNWLNMRYNELQGDNDFMQLLNRFILFLKGNSNEKQWSWSTSLSSTIEQVQQAHELIQIQLSTAQPLLLKNNVCKYNSIFDISLSEMAQQWCINEQDLMGKVTIKDYHYYDVKNQKKAPYILKIIQRFNKMSFWIASQILISNENNNNSQSTFENSKKINYKFHASVITYFINLMDELKKFQNWNGIMQIFSALNMNVISRMSKTWAFVSPKNMSIFEDYQNTFNNNYKAYREFLEDVNPPFIPLQQVIIHDLTYIDENQSVFENGWINFDKLSLIAKQYNILNSCKNTLYDFRSNDHVDQFVNSQLILSEEELYEKSRNLEPSKSKKAKVKQTEYGGNTAKSNPELKKLLKKEKESENENENETKCFTFSFETLKSEKNKNTIKKAKIKDLNFDNLLSHFQNLQPFRTYLLSIYCPEILDFYLSVQLDFKTLQFSDSQNVKLIATKIYDSFISEDSKQALSLDSNQTRINIKKYLNSDTIKSDLFDQVVNLITPQLKSQIILFKKTL